MLQFIACLLAIAFLGDRFHAFWLYTFIVITGSGVAAGVVCRIQVVDEGIGISEKDRHQIFDEFATGDLKNSGLKKDVTQTGLGLYFCRLVMEAHGGRISVEPNHPHGSIFTVEL